MSLEFFVVGRRALPKRARWYLELDFDEDEDLGLEISASDPKTVPTKYRAGFEPASYVSLRPAWEAAEAVAREVASILDGVVYCEARGRAIFDAAGSGTPCATMAAMEKRIRAVFDGACNDWLAREERGQAANQRRFAELASEDPAGVKEANDWSDVAATKPRRR